MAKKQKSPKATVEQPAQAATIARPEELAKELGVSGKQIRAWLRTQFPDHAKRTSWLLNMEQADAVRARFTPSADDESEE